MSKFAPLALVILGLFFTASGAVVGKRNLTLNQKVRLIGGTEVKPHELPFMVWITKVQKSENDGSVSNLWNSFIKSLQSGIFEASQFVITSNCAGVILAHDWILTAAHCLTDSAKGLETSDSLSVKVYAGVHDRRNLTGHEQQVFVKRIIVHHEFLLSNASNDLTLVQVNPKFIFNEFVQSINFVDSEFATETESKVVIAGWGATNENSTEGTNVLRKITTKVVSYQVCKNAYKYIIPIQDSHLCTDTSEGKGSCFGDSGAPVLCSAGDSTFSSSSFKLCGIVSGSKGCALPNYYQVNTNIAYFSNWIKKIVFNKFNSVFAD